MPTNVALLTNFMEFNPGHSLTGIVIDQAHMLVRHGHKVFIYVSEQFNPKYNEDSGLSGILKKYPGQLQIQEKTKFMHLIDYTTQEDITPDHVRQAREWGEDLALDLIDNNIHVVYTHDFIFTGWNLPFAQALKTTQDLFYSEDYYCAFYHWIHSVPSAHRDWWNIEKYGPNHQIVFPNRTTIMQVAENFNTTPARVRIIPHIKDIRTWYDFSSRTMDFLDKYPSILSSDVVQVYPCSTDRLSAKQLDIVIRIFGEFKKMKMNVCLIAANQWATGRQPMENIRKYTHLAVQQGLEYGKEFLFTSEFLSHEDIAEEIYACDTDSGLDEVREKMKGMGIVPKGWQQQGETLEEKQMTLCEFVRPYARGIDRRMLRELQLCSSLFVFPTKEESFGLVGPESSFSGCLNVNNRSLTMMSEVMGHMAPSFDFGSFHMIHEPTQDQGYIHQVAVAILHRLFMNESVLTKNYCRIRYNMDHLYFRYYKPLTLL